MRKGEKGYCPAPPAPKGNTRAMVHGADTPSLIAPRREAHLRVLRADYPALDHRRLTLLADRLARIDLATEWLEKQKSIVRNRQGDVYRVAELCDKWACRAEQVIKEAEAESRRPKKIDLAMEMSNLGVAEDALNGPLDTTFDG